MPLSEDFIDEHISSHELMLKASYRSYREKWPSRLFHHTPLQNALDILKAGQLLSRKDSQDVRTVDVAGQDVIKLRSEAHSFVRLYFRPRTPTQCRIEGIRKPSEYYNGQPTAHAPVLIMLVLKAKSILLLPGVQFSNSNMQSAYAEHADTEEFFAKIPFDKVYHEGGTGGDNSIISHRCAEVLAPSPLDLKNHLQWVYCRSVAERQTLLSGLGDAAEGWSPFVKVSDDIQVFQKDYVYVDRVTLQPDGVVFQLHHRSYPHLIDIELKAWDSRGNEVASFIAKDWCSIPQGAGVTQWRTPAQLESGVYTVQISLEGCARLSRTTSSRS